MPLNPILRWAQRCAIAGASLVAVGCALAPATPEPAASAEAPPAWQAPLPHGGSATALAAWWQELGDPLLLELIEAAQAVSPSVASARSRLTQARATLSSAQGANQPGLSASLSGQRGVNSSSPVVGTGLQASLDASWEIDLFGANRASAQAAAARVDGNAAQWHEARVSVAAETANQYLAWRTCQQLLAVLQADAQSREASAQLNELIAKAGMAAPASAALARASAAEGRARVTQQASQCDSTIKALVALTALDEPGLRQRLQTPAPAMPASAMPQVSTLPAEVLTQRPDLYTAERDLAAASADVGAAQAQRYPRLGLSGQVGALNYSSQGVTTDLSTWSIGPLVLSLPLLDGNRRAANVQAAQARYTEAAALYRAKVRQAVREVEDALLALHSSSAQQADAEQAAQGYAAAFQATEARWRAGSASLPELEDARRIMLAAQSNLLQLGLQRQQAWISLYRALGGGWNRSAPIATDTP